MCRAAGRRCPNCNDPQTRRDRQNLAYAVNKAQGEAEKSSPSTIAPAEPQTLAEALAQEAKVAGFEEFDEKAIADTMASMLADPKVAKAVSADLRNDRLSAEDNKTWLLNGREDTPENLAAGIAERQEQIILVGTVVAERAAAIHGVDIDAEREAWEKRTQDAQDAYKEKRKEADEKTANWHSLRRQLSEEKDVSVQVIEEHLTPEEKVEVDRLKDIKNAANRDSMDAHLVVQKLMKGEDEETQAVLDKIAEGNRLAIAEVREVGNEKPAFRNSIRGGDKVGNTFSSVINETFPDEWVKKSNELGNLALKRTAKTNGRAHYKEVPSQNASFMHTHTGQPNPNDDRFADWTEKLDENGNSTGKWHGLKRDFLADRNINNFRKFEGNAPKGKGWRRGQAEGTSGRMVQGWVRDNATAVKYTKSLEAPEAEITVYMNETDRETRRVITHEFSHRIEDANRHIPMLEEGFLASRTTLDNGRRETLKVYKKGSIIGTVALNTGKFEVVREDNFVDPYMGKEYTQSQFREVLSMGSEAVFSGSEGGLVGIGKNRADPQMRNWVLGVYATM